MKKFLKYIAVSLLSGVSGAINGFFGGGGGMLLVPLLEKMQGLPTKKAHATAIAVILPISASSAATYVLNGHFEWFPFTFTAVGCILGGIAGALLLKKLRPTATALVFALLMVGVGIKLTVGT